MIRRAEWTAFFLMIASMIGMALLMSAELPANSEVADLALSFLGIAALIQLADGVQVVCMGMLRG